jgi:tetratricopeptide (TPR) repeat protein
MGKFVRLSFVFILTLVTIASSCARNEPTVPSMDATEAKPVSFSISDFTINPEEVSRGSPVTIEVMVTNVGELLGTYDVILKIDDIVEATKRVTLEGGTSQNVTFSVYKFEGKTYAASIGMFSGTFVVTSIPPSTIPLAIQHENNARLLAQQGQYDEAIAEYSKAIEFNPGYTNLYYYRGRVYYETEQWELAIADFSKAIELSSEYDNAYCCRGLVYYETEQWDLAIADFSKAIELDAEYTSAYYDRGLVYYETEHWDLAIADFSKAIELDSGFANAYHYRGLVYFETEQWDLAIADFSKAIDLDPGFAYAYGCRGIVYFETEQWDLAIADFSKAIELDPMYVKAYINRASAYSANGQKDLAIADLNLAISISQDPALTQIAEDNLTVIQSGE